MIGDLRVRLGLYVPVDKPDDIGGVKTVWEFLRAFWAKVEPRTVSETRETGQLVVTQSYRVTLRYRADFPERSKLIWGHRKLRVITYSDPDNRQERLHLICEEEQ